MWKAMIKVVVEDSIAIYGEILLGKRLPWVGSQFGEGLGLDLLIADDLEGADKSLRTLFDLDVNRELICPVMIIVVDIGLNLGFAETVGNI